MMDYYVRERLPEGKHANVEKVLEALRTAMQHWLASTEPRADVSQLDVVLFGSMASGLATKSSDLDIRVKAPLEMRAYHFKSLARYLRGLGYQITATLVHARVPIIKLREPKL